MKRIHRIKKKTFPAGGGEVLPVPVILFEDTHLLVLDKPAGWLVQDDASGDASLVQWLRSYLGRPYVGLVHRLDRNTSGIMVAAKRTKAASRLSASLQEGEILREYRAWLVGRLAEPVRWHHWLLKDEKKNQVRVLTGPRQNAKEAMLTAAPERNGLWRNHAVTLVRLRLETGRSHQIRVQAAQEGFPVLGDFKYGPYCREAWNREFGRPALHSFFLSFPHPMSGEVMKFEAPFPEDMKGPLG